MLSKTKSLFAATSVVALLAAGTAYGQESFTWNPPASPANLNWDNHANWDSGDPSYENEYPGQDDTNDTVTIPNDMHGNPDLSAGNIAIGTLTIEASAILYVIDRSLTINTQNGLAVAAGAVLNVQQDDGTLIFATATSGAGHDIDGDIELDDADAELLVSASTVISGTGGQIIGRNAAADITVNASFTCNILIMGTLQMGGSSTFTNQGEVRATAGVIDFASGLTLTDVTTDALRWRSTGSGSVLDFNRAHTGGSALVGRFKADNSGAMRFDASITTAGDFVRPFMGTDTNYDFCPGSPVVVGTTNAVFTWNGSSCTIP